MRATEPVPQLSIVTRLRGDALIYGITTVLARGTTFLLVPILTRLLAPDEIGLLEYATIAIGFANVIVSVEVSQALARYIPDPAYRHERKRIASTALWFTTGAYAIAAVAAILLSPVLLPPGLHEIVPFVVATAAASGMLLFLLGQLRWELRPRPYAIASIAYAAVSVAATWVLVANGLGIRAVFIGQTVGALVGLAVALSGTRNAFDLSFDRAWLAKLLQFSAPWFQRASGYCWLSMSTASSSAQSCRSKMSPSFRSATESRPLSRL